MPYQLGQQILHQIQDTQRTLLEHTQALENEKRRRDLSMRQQQQPPQQPSYNGYSDPYASISSYVTNPVNIYDPAPPPTGNRPPLVSIATVPTFFIRNIRCLTLFEFFNKKSTSKNYSNL
jgi:hypothetical protein